jgi:dUTP pyrophosphatase
MRESTSADEARRVEVVCSEPRVRVELLPEHPAAGSRNRETVAPARDGDAGIDLVACEEVTLRPGERAAVSAGMRIALPPGVEAQIRPRSGQAIKRGLTVLNTPGTVDPGYRGVVRVILFNAAAPLTPEDLDGPVEELRDRLAAALEERTIRIAKGDRVAQLVFSRFERPRIELVDSVGSDTDRGEGGFGSTDA